MRLEKDSDNVKVIIDSLNIKRSEKLKTEEQQEATAENAPLKCDQEEITDLSTTLLLESDEEEVKEGKESKILIPNKLLTRLYLHK